MRSQVLIPLLNFNLIVLISTGCQDIIYYLKSQSSIKHSSRISKIILQGPVSDREWLLSEDRRDNTLKYLEIATKLISYGTPNELLPRDVDNAPLTAYRYHSLATRMGDDDMFSSDLTDDELIQKMGN